MIGTTSLVEQPVLSPIQPYRNYPPSLLYAFAYISLAFSDSHSSYIYCSPLLTHTSTCTCRQLVSRNFSRALLGFDLVIACIAMISIIRRFSLVVPILT